MHRLIDNTIAQITGYGVVSGTSMLLLSAQSSTLAIDPSGILTIIPSWLISTVWAISSIAFTINVLAGAYKRVMEGRAQLAAAEHSVCVKEECPYLSWIEQRNSSREDAE